MEKHLMKQFLEEFQEQISIYLTKYLFDGNHLDDVDDFVNYCLNKAKEDIYVPRRGGSYFEVANSENHGKM